MNETCEKHQAASGVQIEADGAGYDHSWGYQDEAYSKWTSFSCCFVQLASNLKI